MRRSQALHPAALLVHQNRRVPADGVAKRLNEFLHLLWRAYISLEDDQAPGLGLAEEGALGGGQRGPAKPVMKARAAIGAD